MTPTVDALITSADRGDRTAASALFAALYDELHRLAQRQLARQQGPAGLGATTLLHEAYLAICDRSGRGIPRPRALHGLRGARHARADHRRRAGPPGAEARGRPVSHHAGHRRDAAGRESAVAGAHQRCARRTGDARSGARGAGRPEILLRLLLGGNRRAARRLGTDREAGLGKEPASISIARSLRTRRPSDRPFGCNSDFYSPPRQSSRLPI